MTIVNSLGYTRFEYKRVFLFYYIFFMDDGYKLKNNICWGQKTKSKGLSRNPFYTNHFKVLLVDKGFNGNFCLDFIFRSIISAIMYSIFFNVWIKDERHFFFVYRNYRLIGLLYVLLHNNWYLLFMGIINIITFW